MTTEDSIELEVKVVAEDTTDDDLKLMALNLRSELRQIKEVSSVDLLKLGPAPDKSKAGEVEAISTLAVQVLPSVLPSLFTMVQDWIARGHGGRTVKIKYEGIEFEGSREDFEKILERLEKGKKKK